MAGPEGGRGLPRELSPREIDEFLRGQRIARLGCHSGGTTYVVPLIYAYEEGAVVAVTTEGRKTAMLRENPRVCVEVDEYDADGKGSWRSVIAAEPRPLGPNVVVLRVELEETSGRTVER
jgi:nitroimidazol reductase NimA-like FMN-containing flavoprotein (pyridoxamine 5'-phosphate oxidase superfamily)